jgi:hypothetical protein
MTHRYIPIWNSERHSLCHAMSNCGTVSNSLTRLTHNTVSHSIQFVKLLTKTCVTNGNGCSNKYLSALSHDVLFNQSKWISYSHWSLCFAICIINFWTIDRVSLNWLKSKWTELEIFLLHDPVSSTSHKLWNCPSIWGTFSHCVGLLEYCLIFLGPPTIRKIWLKNAFPCSLVTQNDEVMRED